MTVVQWLRKTYLMCRYNINYIIVRPNLVCKDGFRISVQASTFHHCNPHRNLETGLYNSVEVLYFRENISAKKSEDYELLCDTYDGDDSMDGIIFSYVPIDIIQKVVDMHGGIDVRYVN